ncbi:MULTISPECIES: hypothetical protein [unclassified Streptomyces]|uniref:WapI family immunity protein n=1 Tax=unclassified Streptomyces TaxID=2593676 RepID=UPI002253194E|nr:MULTISPECIES: hypothetical protein [unclassified Streptomyces]MCX4404438.1 hypothetical protein [Streptomyces sp. NBC_01764]MCX5191021.1 hypothetical protein [Streptomyces sp. NBC_00268]
MRLIDSDGHGIELRVTDYQFPDAAHMGKRRSWLIVEGTANCPQGAWTFRWQALTPEDAIALATWLRDFARSPDGGQQADDSLEFIEPNLAFAATRADAHQIALQIRLDLEFSPPWRKRNRAGDPFTVVCRMTPEAPC